MVHSRELRQEDCPTLLVLYACTTLQLTTGCAVHCLASSKGMSLKEKESKRQQDSIPFLVSNYAVLFFNSSTPSSMIIV